MIDPRRTRTAEIDDLHLPVRPGTDVAPLQSLLFEVALAGGPLHELVAVARCDYPSLASD